MSEALTLKQRIRNGESINVGGASVDASQAALQGMLDREPCDLIFVDSQHMPLNEEKLRAFCGIANSAGVGAILRLKHTRHAYLSGNFLDLGPLAILVPQVETEATVDEAIAAFYYPPVGKRSWGPSAAYGFSDHSDRLEYAEWWNSHGILCLQIETLNAVVNARKLAKPGVDMLMFGANDLSFDLETYSDPPFGTVEECIEHVQQQMRGTGVKVAAGMTPVGAF